MQWLQTLCWSWKACFIVGHGWFGDGDAHWASALVRQVRHHRAFTPVCSEQFRWFESSLLWRTFWFFWKSPYSEIVLRVSRLGILYIDEKLWYSGTHVLVLATVWVIMSSPKQVLDTCLPPVLRFYLRADLIEILWLKSLIPEGSCPSWEGGGYGKQLVQTGLAGFPIQSASNYACTVK